ncbi:Uncharacterized protein PHSC3_000475 [Chlamydiales bacterium STE3]|nr:Uncharacterized protein PHSC3_000475 [Chlamydiales bacterium STE3]
MKKTAIVWFRQDLRLEDHPALQESSSYDTVIPLFVWSPNDKNFCKLGAASRWWLHHSLESLNQELMSIGLNLVIRVGEPQVVLNEVIRETHAEAVFWNRRYEPCSLSQDSRIKQSLKNDGILVKSFNGRLLYEPWEIANKQKKPFQVFTPFWNSCLAFKNPERPLPKPEKLISYQGTLSSEKLEKLQLLPTIAWDEGIKKNWQPGSVAAKQKAEEFIRQHLKSYHETRDRPDLPHGVSHLSPYLHFGEITSRMLWHAVLEHFGEDALENQGAFAFLRQLGWREFAYHLLYHFPSTPEQPLRKSFNHFPWENNQEQLKAWQSGRTGYPFVDAGMRELWTTGWMHNRLRLVVGSFLVKHLRLHWLEGEKWFWDTLVDADLANNCMGWQWVAGCGADAAPYFRIFNPVTQAEKFDPEGNYVRKWVPELAKLPTKWIHKPWEAPYDILANADVKLGKDYPYPIVDHAEARQKALEAFEKIKA